MIPRSFLGYLPFLLLLLALVPVAAFAACPPAPVFCEGWSRDSTRREVSLSRTTLCNNGVCAAVCTTVPIVALPSVRIQQREHIVLGFGVSDACVPECAGAPAEPCHNLGISYRNVVATGNESVTGVYDCDPTDPGTTVSSGATFNATYQIGGTVNVSVSNVVYGFGSGPDDCGASPTSFDLAATGPNMGIQSQFGLTWFGGQVVGYYESRTYTNSVPPLTVHIAVSNIDYGAGTYDVSVPDAPTPTLQSTWGKLKVLYR